MRKQAGNHSLIGIVTARSSDVPVVAADLSYTVEVDDGDSVISYEQVMPGMGYRATDTPSIPPELLLIPFHINQAVPIAVQVAGNEDRLSIMVGEHINIKTC